MVWRDAKRFFGRGGAGVALGVAFAAACGLLVPWAEFGDVGFWPRNDRLAALGVLVGFAFTAAQIVGPIWWEQRTTGHGPGSPAVTAVSRGEWRVALAERVLVQRRGQLDQLVGLDHRIEIEAFTNTSRLPESEGTQARISVTGPTLHVSDLAAHWDWGHRRLVLLGEPGSGKSHAALTLTIETTERSTVESGPVAEMFLLNRWYAWHLDHPDTTLEHWFADELATTYDIPEVIATELITMGTIAPVLDGLDEVPPPARAICASRIADYSGRATHRPFFLSCRVEEYRTLIDWVPADQTYTIRPLSPATIAATIRATQERRRGWEAVLANLEVPGAPLAQLLSAPLRLTTALEAYRDADPTELATLALDEASRTIWDRFLHPPTPVAYRHHGIDKIHGWLTWLATRMQATDRQTITLHELTHLDPHRTRHVRAYKAVLGLVVGMAVGLVAGLVLGMVVELAFGLVAGLVAGLAFGMVVGPGTADDLVTVSAKVSLSKRLQTRRDDLPPALILGLINGLVAGLINGPVVGLVVGLAFGLAVGLAIGLVNGLDAARHTYRPEDSTAFHAKHPRAVLRASAQSGLAFGLVAGLVVGLAFGLVLGLVVGLGAGLIVGLGAGLAFGLVVGLAFGLAFGLGYGIDAVLYHWWLSRCLARSGFVPTQLDQFLEWCAGTRGHSTAEGTTNLDRHWLRQAGGQFQFRHRQLQEHLAHPHKLTRAD